MIIDFKASGIGEFLQQRTQGCHGGHIPPGEDKCIVCVLENRCRESRIRGVAEQAGSGGTENQTLEDVSDNDEQVG